MLGICCPFAKSVCAFDHFHGVISGRDSASARRGCVGRPWAAAFSVVVMHLFLVALCINLQPPTKVGKASHNVAYRECKDELVRSASMCSN